MKVLIISLNAIGDSYLSASAIEPLKKHYKNASISFLVNQGSELFTSNLTDRIIFLKEKKILQILKLFRVLYPNKYDLILCFFPGLVNTFFFLLLRSKIKLGFINFLYTKNWYKISRKLFIFGAKKSNLMWFPEMNYLDKISLCFKALNIPSSNLSKIKFAVQNTYSKNDYIVIHFKSQDVCRSLNINCLLQLLQYLLKLNKFCVYIIGTKSDFEKHYEIISKFDNTFLLIDEPLNMILRLLLNSKLFIGVDSFPIHLADAYSINFLGLFADTNPSSVLINSDKAVKFNLDSLFDLTADELIDKVSNYLTKTNLI